MAQSKQLAEEVKKAIGDLSISQAAYKSGVSYEYLRTMATYGRIPSESILEKFAKGLDADLHALRVAAGYDKPDTDAILDNVLVRVKAKGQLTEADLKLLHDLLDEARQKLK